MLWGLRAACCHACPYLWLTLVFSEGDKGSMQKIRWWWRWVILAVLNFQVPLKIFLGCAMWYAWILVPWPRIEPSPLDWEYRVLTTGPPEKSPGSISFEALFLWFGHLTIPGVLEAVFLLSQCECSFCYLQLIHFDIWQN